MTGEWAFTNAWQSGLGAALAQHVRINWINRLFGGNLIVGNLFLFFPSRASHR